MKDDIEYQYDVATALTKGRRELQEDALALHFPAGSELGYIVLADGMGGHAAGDVASTIVVQEVCAALRLYADDPPHLEHNIGPILSNALDRANSQIARHTSDSPELHGMGSTLVASLIIRNRLYWISVGDSPLYLLRRARMSRLNQEHSLARRMDRMVLNGLMSRQEADLNPDRDCLTSVLFGAAIPEVDRRDYPIDLMDGDILIVASDGLQTMDDTRIASLVHVHRNRPSAEICSRLLKEIADMDDPYQDNVSFCVVKVAGKGRATQAPSPHPDGVTRTSVQLRVASQGKRVSVFYFSQRKG